MIFLRQFLNVIIVLLIYAPWERTEAFQLDLDSKLKSENGAWYFNDSKFISGKGVPVHESLILKSVLAANLPQLNDEEKVNLIEDLVIGVRWNDDPLQMFRQDILGGALTFKHSCKKDIAEKVDSEWDLHYRTHCGDMQFLHAMASSESEVAADTYKKMIAWMEYSYRVATGSLHGDLYFKGVHYRMTGENAKIFKSIMLEGNPKRKMWRADGLFSLKCKRRSDLKCEQIPFSQETTRNIALGSLLHVLQDSFSRSHTARNSSGELLYFGFYNDQRQILHNALDREYVPPTEIELINISAKIIEAVVNDRYRDYPFDKVIRTELDSWGEVSKEVIVPALRPVRMESKATDLGLM
ncbi:hypothetical protein L2725_03335 [Shewanella corallii]|uniref:Uncharacterized protein n=1 Tax=Shewanella corallii TaxID=560080 RepID=A0ABT0N4M6_9GAMM|nr:hypothetical protein [Shewanella corallii]MCL2912826.1 hypothetical protein [Shewanella corallii]